LWRAQVVTVLQHLDLRDKRRGAGISLDEIAVALYGVERAGGAIGTISRWERGLRLNLPDLKTRKDYEQALNALIRERRDA
jgi:transcriptional regulator with XRE-family HTH domain